MDDIIGFYKGKYKNSSGHSLEEIWEWDDDQLEKGHTYIQWMFPSDEESKKVPGSPVLSQFDIKEFNTDDDLKRRLLKSFAIFIRFLGLKVTIENGNIETLKFVKAQDFNEKSSNWLNANNHNHLRISRALRSLTILGCPKIASLFYECLSEICDEYPDKVTDKTKLFWKFAISGEEK